VEGNVTPARLVVTVIELAQTVPVKASAKHDRVLLCHRATDVMI
jgi:hypothetical protein